MAAAVFQVWRTALQARLRGALPPGAAGFVRYLYALPADFVFVGLSMIMLRQGLPTGSIKFVFLCLAGGVAQIFGTILLLNAFAHRSFVVGTAYAKTEAAQLVVFSVFIQHIHVGLPATIGILLAVSGVFVLSFAGQQLSLRSLARASVQPAALFGLAAGSAFAVTAISLRAASLELSETPILLKAVVILALTNTLQTLVQGGYMALRTPRDLYAALRLWKRGAVVGILSSFGSGCWFAAFALANVALVRGFGQIEILLTLVVGHFWLKEIHKRGEAAGLLLVGAGVVLIAIAGSQ